MNIQQALAQLDPERDEDWTADGLPRMDRLSELTGDDKLTRAQVSEVAPELVRETAPDLLLPKTDDAPFIECESSLDDGSVLDRPLAEIFGDYDLAKRAMGELDERIVSKVRERSKLTEELDRLNRQNEMLKRQVSRMENARPALRDPNGGVQAYLRTQQRNREERANRMRAFTQAGTTPKEVLASMSGSPIDRAMSTRRPALGSQRPTIPPAKD